MMHKSRALSSFREISHGFFPAKDENGSSLSVAITEYDDEAEVLKRRLAMMNAINPASPPDLVILKQIHSDKVIVIDSDWKSSPLPAADGMVTRLKGVALGIMTADCAPVLFFDSESQIIGACHAGWRGAVSGVIENTINAMESLGAQRKCIVAAAGPMIDQQNYEVGPELPLKVLRESHRFSDFFKKSPKTSGHFLFNLPVYVQHILLSQGINTIENTGISTYSDEFFSRRFTIDNNSPYQKRCNLSTIAINDFL